MLPLPPAAIDPVSLAIIGGVGAAGLVGLGSAGAIYRWWNRKPPLLPYIPSYIEKLDEADKTPVVRFIAAYHDMMMFMADAQNTIISREYRTLNEAELEESFLAHCDAVIQHGSALLESIGSSEAQVKREREAYGDLKIVWKSMHRLDKTRPQKWRPIRNALQGILQTLEEKPRDDFPHQAIKLPPLSAWDATELEITRRVIHASRRDDKDTLLVDADIHRWLTAWTGAAVFGGTRGPTQHQRLQSEIHAILHRLPQAGPIPSLALDLDKLINRMTARDFVENVYLAIWRARNYQQHAEGVSPRTLRRALRHAVELYIDLTIGPSPNPLHGALVLWSKNTLL